MMARVHGCRLVSPVWLTTLALTLLNGGSAEDRNAPSLINITFNVKGIPADPLYTPISRFEYSERNTSAAYDLWNQINMTIVEWPGNVTTMEPSWPLLKWRHPKAKLVTNQCNIALGMHFYGYAFEYVHLTWGPFRITTSYCPPLKIPRSIFKPGSLESSDTSPILPASDFAFVSNAFLTIVDNRFLVRVSNLEASFLDEGVLKMDRNTISYSLATGISHQIDKLVTQACCTRDSTCRYGNTVFAYSSRPDADDSRIFVSFDGGKHFNQLILSSSQSPLVQLQALIAFPQRHELLVMHAITKSQTEISRYNMTTGELISSNISLISVKGNVQALRFGEEMSFLVWDNCQVWYSPDAGHSMKQGLFYYHNTIPTETGVRSPQSKQKHSIQSQNCHLEHSSVAYDQNGKLGLLDSMNSFFYGVDLKSSSNYFPLVANRLDMTLMKNGTENSIVPNFDVNGRPKLLYPPKYLHCDHPAVNDDKFPKRLAVKLLPKTIFPSDFMPPFYEENIPKKFKQFGIQKCLTSGIRIDSSLTQSPQTFTSFPIKFQLEFKSFVNSSNQLRIEPDVFKDLLNIDKKLVDFTQLGTRQYYYFKYIISISEKSGTTLNDGDVMRLNFHTVKSLRCIHQPQQTVWIQISKSQDSASKYGMEEESLETSGGESEWKWKSNAIKFGRGAIRNSDEVLLRSNYIGSNNNNNFQQCETRTNG